MNHGSLFSGIGGFELAAEWAGWTNVFHCEINPFGRKVLEYYWPESISYEDIKKTDFTKHRGTVDVLSGGFPCQPFSAAGKRKGTDDDRHLWPEMLRAIREIQPAYVVGENVRGFTNWNGGMVFDQVQTDLEAEGYEVLPFLLPACAVNAPHRRDRIWIVAHNSDAGIEAMRGWENKVYANESTPNTRSTEHKRGNTSEGQQLSGRGQTWGEPTPHDRDVANATILRRPSEEHGQEGSGRIAETSLRNDWSNFPTQLPVRQRNDGIYNELVGITVSKHRNESIKAYGNAIVPQVAYEIFKVINKMNDERQDMDR